MKKLKYLLLIMVATFMSLASVDAESGVASANGQKFITSFSGTFADNTNNQLTRIPAGFDAEMFFYWSDPITLTGSNRYGAAVIFDTLEPLVAGYTYSISILLNNDYNVVMQPTESRICVAETLNNAITRYNQPNNFNCTNAIHMAHTTGKPNPFYIDNTNWDDSLGWSREYHILTYIFTPDFTGTSVVFNFNTTNNVSQTYTLFFGGYIQTLLSDNKNGLSSDEISNIVQNSGLATANSVEQVQSEINSIKSEMQTQTDEQIKTNEKLDDLNNNLTSDDVTKSEDEANSFFDSFSTTDNGGISSIVTAPLVAIEKMLSGTCTPLTATYSGKTISLPCGSDFWNRMPEIRTFLNVVLGGFLCYGILSKLYLLIDRLKNPEDDRVDVMKL